MCNSNSNSLFMHVIDPIAAVYGNLQMIIHLHAYQDNLTHTHTHVSIIIPVDTH